MLNRKQRQVMGFTPSGFVFADDNPPVSGEDLKAAVAAIKRRPAPTLQVSVRHGIYVTIELSEIVEVVDSPEGLKVPGDSRVSDWRFAGVVCASSKHPALQGYTVRGYAVGGYNRGNEEDVVDLYAQLAEPRA